MAEENRNGLVQRRIRTKKGNVVLRWVKPDNPNIVADEVPMQRQRQARRQAPQQPKADAVEPVVAVETPKIEYDYFWRPHDGCCGGTIVQRKVRSGSAAETEERRVERITKQWEADMYGKRQCDLYKEAHERSLKDYEFVLKAKEAGRQPAQRWTYNQRDIYDFYNEAQIKTQVDRLKTLINQVYDVGTYSLGQALKDGASWSNRKNKNSYINPSTPSYGTTIALFEFPQSFETAIPGVWARSDFNTGNGNEYRPENGVVVTEFTKDTFPLTGKKVNYTHYQISKAADDHLVYYGITDLGGSLGINVWGQLKGYNTRTKIKPGTVVTLILNHNQISKKRHESLNDCGFTHLSVTGNRNHPGSSVLYLYGRRLTEKDVELLNNA